jgi:RimJ/RimL family protein N-acetyltransferase
VPYSHGDAGTWLAKVERNWRSSEERTFTIVERESDRFLGVVTIRLREGGSVGFWLTREARGQGVMTEAVKAVVKWARTKQGIRRLYITAHPENLASQRVAEKAGSSASASPPTIRRSAMARARPSGSNSHDAPDRLHQTPR